jgi:hypothetical protein
MPAVRPWPRERCGCVRPRIHPDTRCQLYKFCPECQAGPSSYRGQLRCRDGQEMRKGSVCDWANRLRRSSTGAMAHGGPQRRQFHSPEQPRSLCLRIRRTSSDRVTICRRRAGQDSPTQWPTCPSSRCLPSMVTRSRAVARWSCHGKCDHGTTSQGAAAGQVCGLPRQVGDGRTEFVVVAGREGVGDGCSTWSVESANRSRWRAGHEEHEAETRSSTVRAFNAMRTAVGCRP